MLTPLIKRDKSTPSCYITLDIEGPEMRNILRNSIWYRALFYPAREPIEDKIFFKIYNLIGRVQLGAIGEIEDVNSTN